MDKQTIDELIRKSMKEFPLYSEEHKVQVVMTKDGACISYSAAQSNIPFECTHFDIEIIKDTCFINYIGLEKQYRGRGLGKKLYHIIEEFARSAGCRKVALTPSGTTEDGKLRTDYMLALGYKEVGIRVEKEL